MNKREERLINHITKQVEKVNEDLKERGHCLTTKGTVHLVINLFEESKYEK